MKKGDKMVVGDKATSRSASSSSSRLNVSVLVKDLFLGPPHLQKKRSIGR